MLFRTRNQPSADTQISPFCVSRPAKKLRADSTFAVRILLTRVVKERGLPPGLTTDPEFYDAWFKAKVLEAMEDTRAAASHNQVMDDARKLIERKRLRKD